MNYMHIYIYISLYIPLQQTSVGLFAERYLMDNSNNNHRNSDSSESICSSIELEEYSSLLNIDNGSRFNDSSITGIVGQIVQVDSQSDRNITEIRWESNISDNDVLSFIHSILNSNWTLPWAFKIWNISHCVVLNYYNEENGVDEEANKSHSYDDNHLIYDEDILNSDDIHHNSVRNSDE